MAERRIRLIRAIASTALALLGGCAGTPPGREVEVSEVAIRPRAGTQTGEPAGTPTELSPASQALLAQSRAQQRAGETHIAAAILERAIRIDPQHPLPWLELGRLRLAEGRREQAESLARKALTLAGGDPQLQAEAQQLLEQAQH